MNALILHSAATVHRWVPSSASLAFSPSVSSCLPLLLAQVATAAPVATRPSVNNQRSGVNGGRSQTLNKPSSFVQ